MGTYCPAFLYVIPTEVARRQGRALVINYDGLGHLCTVATLTQCEESMSDSSW